MKGQALVEFALVLPLLLLFTLGAFQVGVALIARSELEHAVREAAVAGASEPSQPQRCTTALDALDTIYGRHIQDTACVPAVGSALEITATVPLPLFIPGGDAWNIRATARAVIRR